jgi:hypothetical protein
MKTTKCLGINNVTEPTALEPGEFASAVNVFVGVAGKLSTRPPRTRIVLGVAGSPQQWGNRVLLLLNCDLVEMDEAGGNQRVIYPTLGPNRVWYAELPDGRMAFSNGLINGLIAPGGVATPWGLPTPEDCGSGMAGGTRYQITYVRNSDGLEGPPAYSADLIDPTKSIVGLPQLPGFAINVYFAPYGGEAFLAGSTTTDTFAPTGAELGPQYLGHGLSAPPVGTQLTVWGSRVLIAEGSVLWATRPLQPELCDKTTDFVQFPDPITLVYGTGEGIFVGTTRVVYFLEGKTFDALSMDEVSDAPATLGSVVPIDLSELNDKARPQSASTGAVCIIGGVPSLLTGSGEVTPLTAETYQRDLSEVYATARPCDGHLQYIAAPA